jgi:hypothetical protein
MQLKIDFLQSIVVKYMITGEIATPDLYCSYFLFKDQGHVNLVPFHGDIHNLSTVNYLVTRGWVDTFIELGSYYGGTTFYMSYIFHMPVISCEPLDEHYDQCIKTIAGLHDVNLTKETSMTVLQRHPFANRKPLFYVDSHGNGFKWELLNELDEILSTYERGFIMIDDFKIPDRPDFCYDAYDGYECSIEYISPILLKHNKRTIWLSNHVANYGHHTLRGYCVIQIGNDTSIQWPDLLRLKLCTIPSQL